MNKLFSALDRLDDFLAWHPWAAMLVASALGFLYAIIVINLP